VYPKSPGSELQGTPKICAIGARGGSIFSMRWCLMVNSPFSGTPPATPGFWQEFDRWTHKWSESLGCKLQGAPMISVIRARGGSICSIRWRLKANRRFWAPPWSQWNFGGKLTSEPRILGKPRLRAARCANDQRHQIPCGEYMFDTVTFEVQITSFWRAVPRTFDKVQDWYGKPHIFRKPCSSGFWKYNKI